MITLFKISLPIFFLVKGLVSDESIFTKPENKTWIFMLNDHNEPVLGSFAEPPLKRAGRNEKISIDFKLFTREQPNGIPINSTSDLDNTTFDPRKPTKFITHGWLSSGESDTCLNIKDGYLKSFDVNVFIMNWNKIARHYFYYIPVMRVPDIADIYASFLNELIQNKGVAPSSLHLIGHSLGAQISGLVGYRISGDKLGRVTGLDPAFPGFDHILIYNKRISNDSAEFVDVIHSCGGLLGLKDAVGHVDFYPNGGTMPQPGCNSREVLEACSHGRSWQYFADSLQNPDIPYYGVACNGWENFILGVCNNNERIRMGECTSTSARGEYYLKTKQQRPFSLETDLWQKYSYH